MNDAERAIKENARGYFMDYCVKKRSISEDPSAEIPRFFVGFKEDFYVDTQEPERE